MKKISYLILFIFFCSCTSNTIFEKPKDLIPKDTLSLLIQEMLIAKAAKYNKNKNLEKSINYMPLVYSRFKIDSLRFKRSNLYYLSKIDEYQKIISDAKASLQKRKFVFDKMKNVRDSLKNDSVQKVKKLKERKLSPDSLQLKKITSTKSIKEEN